MTGRCPSGMSTRRCPDKRVAEHFPLDSGESFGNKKANRRPAAVWGDERVPECSGGRTDPSTSLHEEPDRAPSSCNHNDRALSMRDEHSAVSRDKRVAEYFPLDYGESLGNKKANRRPAAVWGDERLPECDERKDPSTSSREEQDRGPSSCNHNDWALSMQDEHLAVSRDKRVTEHFPLDYGGSFGNKKANRRPAAVWGDERLPGGIGDVLEPIRADNFITQSRRSPKEPLGRPTNPLPECSESKNGHPVALVTMLKPIRADNFISQPRRSPKEPHDESHEMVLVPDSDSAMEGRYWYVNRNRFPNQYGDERYQRCEDPRAEGRYVYDDCAPKNRDASVQQENEPGDPSAGVFCSRNFVSRTRDPRTPSVSNHYSQSEEQQPMQGRTQRPQVQKSAHSRPSVNRPPPAAPVLGANQWPPAFGPRDPPCEGILNYTRRNTNHESEQFVPSGHTTRFLDQDIIAFAPAFREDEQVLPKQPALVFASPYSASEYPGQTVSQTLREPSEAQRAKESSRSMAQGTGQQAGPGLNEASERYRSYVTEGYTAGHFFPRSEENPTQPIPRQLQDDTFQFEDHLTIGSANDTFLPADYVAEDGCPEQFRPPVSLPSHAQAPAEQSILHRDVWGSGQDFLPRTPSEKEVVTQGVERALLFLAERYPEEMESLEPHRTWERSTESPYRSVFHSEGAMSAPQNILFEREGGSSSSNSLFPCTRSGRPYFTVDMGADIEGLRAYLARKLGWRLLFPAYR